MKDYYRILIDGIDTSAVVSRIVCGKSWTGAELSDGSFGIAKQLQRRLEEQKLLNPGPGPGHVEFRNSLDEPEILELSQALFSYEDGAL